MKGVAMNRYKEILAHVDAAIMRYGAKSVYVVFDYSSDRVVVCLSGDTQGEFYCDDMHHWTECDMDRFNMELMCRQVNCEDRYENSDMFVSLDGLEKNDYEYSYEDNYDLNSY